MKLQQAHYTSCLHGITGTPGFQIQTCTPGLRDSAERIGAACSYAAPLSLLRVKDAAHVEFPVRLRYEVDGAGGWLLGRVVYRGLDATGQRLGNYFGHVLTADEPLRGRWAVDAAAWPGWTSRPAPGSELGAPPALAELAADALFPEDTAVPAWISAFAAAGEARPAVIAAIVDAIREYASSRRPALVRADSGDCVAWIAAATRVFPWHLAAQIGFCSYQARPRGMLQLNATTDDAGFEFTERDRRSLYAVIDARAVDPPPGGRRSRFAGWASAAIAREPARLTRFHAFAAGDVAGLAMDELDAAVAAFEMAEGTGVDPAALAWAVRRVADRRFIDLCRVSGSATARAAEPDDWAGVVGRLVRLAQGSAEIGELAAELLAAGIRPRDLVPTQLEALRASRTQLAAVAPEAARRFDMCVVAAVPAWAADGAPSAVIVQLLEVAAAVVDEERLAALLAEPAIDAAVFEGWWLRRMATCHPERASGAAAVIAWVARRVARAPDADVAERRLGAAVAEAYAAIDRATLRAEMAAHGLIEALAAEYATSLRRDGVSERVARELGSGTDELRLSVLELLDPPRAARLAEAWVTGADEERFDEALAERVLALANLRLAGRLGQPDAHGLATALARAAERRQVVLAPDRPALHARLGAVDRVPLPSLVSAADVLPAEERAGWAHACVHALGAATTVKQLERSALLAPLDGFAGAFAAEQALAGGAALALALDWWMDASDAAAARPVVAALVESSRAQPAAWRRGRIAALRANSDPERAARVRTLAPPASVTAKLSSLLRGLFVRRGGLDG